MKLLLLLALVGYATAMVSYKGHEVWRVATKNLEDKKQIHGLTERFNLDLWGESSSHVDVHVSPIKKQGMEKLMGVYNLKFEVLVEDVEDILQSEKYNIHEPRSFSLKAYNTFEDIEVYLKGINDSNPMATLETIGKGWEGKRDQWMISFSTDPTAHKEAIWIDCAIHAREWITTSTCLYIIDAFNTGSDPDTAQMLKRYDVYIMPVVNPDGYAYTWADEGDRMWRKNRNVNNGGCLGVDLNRNFDDHFGGPGTGDQPCGQTYRGVSAASEPETQNQAAKMASLQASNGLNILYSIHSYSQLWMWPYGWTTELCADDDDLRTNANIGYAALTAVHGTKYELGPVAGTIYPASSTTIDYSYDKVGVKYSYTLELRDTGAFGFTLPAIEITPVAEETWAGLKAAILAVP